MDNHTLERHIGAKLEIDGKRIFDEKMRAYSEELSQLLREGGELTGKIKEVLDSLGYRLR